MIKKILHRLAHWFSCNNGYAEAYHDKDYNLMMHFRCSGCGEIDQKSIHYVDRIIDMALKNPAVGVTDYMTANFKGINPAHPGSAATLSEQEFLSSENIEVIDDQIKVKK